MNVKRFTMGTVIILLLMSYENFAGNKELLMSLAVPGLGQLSAGSKIKGLSFMALQAVTLHYFINQNSLYRSHNQNITNRQRSLAELQGNSYLDMQGDSISMEKSYQEAQDLESMAFTILPAITALVWAANVVDIFLFPPTTKAKESEDEEDEEEEEEGFILKDFDYKLTSTGKNMKCILYYNFN